MPEGPFLSEWAQLYRETVFFRLTIKSPVWIAQRRRASLHTKFLLSDVNLFVFVSQQDGWTSSQTIFFSGLNGFLSFTHAEICFNQMVLGVFRRADRFNSGCVWHSFLFRLFTKLHTSRCSCKTHIWFLVSHRVVCSPWGSLKSSRCCWCFWCRCRRPEHPQ